VILSVFLLVLFSVTPSWSFPEFSRHGYVNCTACHVSPSGGGVLNPYGRELSKEALSTWGAKNEQLFAYGLVKTPPHVNLQGFGRVLQIHRETPTIKQARTIIMQADLEASYTYKKVTLVGSVGRQEQIQKGEKVILPISRRHYVLWQPKDSILVRTGKFNRYFGLNTPYHTSYVQRDLLFGQDTESYNFELSYYYEKFTVFLTSIFGNFQDKTSFATEKAQTASVQYYFDKQKVGLSYLYGTDEAIKRNVLGPWFILSYQKNFYWMSELFYQNKVAKESGDSAKGYTSTNRFNYELYKGFIPFLTFESSQIDWTAEATKKQSYGVGVQWFPRPHWELMGTYQKDRLYIGDGYFADTFWFMANFYL
jgi:hypothetical protein